MLSPPLVSEALPRSLANVQDGLDHPNSQRGLSLQDLKSKGTELCPGSRESPHLGRDRPQWQAVPPCQVEAWEGLEANPFLEPRCLFGPPAVSWPRLGPSPASAWAPAPAGRERHLSPAAPGERPVGRQCWQACPGRRCSSPLFWVRRGCWRLGNQANTHKLSLVSTNVTAALPRSPAQARGSPTPFSPGPKGQSWPELAIETTLGLSPSSRKQTSPGSALSVLQLPTSRPTAVPGHRCSLQKPPKEQERQNL